MARVEGMNLFVAATILSQTTLEDFLLRSPEERLQDFSGLIGVERIVSRLFWCVGITTDIIDRLVLIIPLPSEKR